MYEGVSDDDKAKWADVAGQYIKGRYSFPGASRAWTSAMMATIVSKAGLAQQRTDTPTEIPIPQLINLPSIISPATIHTPDQIIESKKRARAESEPEFSKRGEAYFRNENEKNR
ncbi:hypothetical protein TWF281_002605 [Arthrobotrys megalospora]